MTEEQVRAVCLLAGVEIIALEQLPNGYWPDAEDYVEVRAANPWWRVTTKWGPVVMGWRKRVIELSWRETSVRAIVTRDDVTSFDTLVHAYGMGRLVTYLYAWRVFATEQQRAEQQRDE